MENGRVRGHAMVTEIRVYVEGGGTKGDDVRSRLRQGMSNFLGEIIDLVRSNRIKWQIVACGTRGKTFDDFCIALKTHPQSFNVLLVDSEEPLYLEHGLWEHLRRRDNWDVPKIAEDHCHLMIRMMESRIVADVDSIAQFYGNGFNRNALPKNRNVEGIDKQTLTNALKEATRNTQKGKYDKSHGWDLIGRIDADKARKAAPSCERLFQILITVIQGGDGKK